MKGFLMIIDYCGSLLYSDTPVSDIFISEYMPSMESDFVRIYIYCLFLGKYRKNVSVPDLSKKLLIDEQRVKEGLCHMESLGLIKYTDSHIELVDIKDKEIKKLFRPKTTSTPDEAVLSSIRSRDRNGIISAINNSFFQGLMSPSWYTDIDSWFDRYKFEEDVMYTLFQHCYDHNGLAKSYISKVAENWGSKNIKDSFDLDRYFIEYQKFKDIRLKIVKKLKLSRNLTEYEEEYMEKWVSEYNYGFDVIEVALKQTAGKTNPNFRYLDAVISDWYKSKLKNKADVIAYMQDKNKKSVPSGTSKRKVSQSENFKQREYDDEYYEQLYKNVGE
jgi:DnaD/phage-associated family protein